MAKRAEGISPVSTALRRSNATARVSRVEKPAAAAMTARVLASAVNRILATLAVATKRQAAAFLKLTLQVALPRHQTSADHRRSVQKAAAHFRGPTQA